MNKLVCPFCQKELDKDFDGYYTCYTDNCGCWANGGNGASGSESLWLTLIRTRKALEQSETCCSEWEKQALDYKAELIKTKLALDVAVNGLEKMTWGCDSSDAEHLLKEIKQITGTKDVK